MPQFESTDEPKITIVSGLPRSGTSMMMKMLEAGGLPVLTDGVRTANEDNPEGYYEYERVKKLPDGDSAWLAEAHGKAVKIIATLLPYLPLNYTYKIIFMHRNMLEILASQRKMLVRRGADPNKIDDKKLAQLFQKHLEQINAWLNRYPTIQKFYVNYNELLANPTLHVGEVNKFLNDVLNVDSMLDVVNPTLYRQRYNP